MTTPQYSPFDIAEALGDFPPTQQQAQVIAAPLTPRLVVAGAGSGKTTTMSDRVAWLVANKLVEPEQILGVTFTRKAAGELAERIQGKLRGLRRSGLLGPDAQLATAPHQSPFAPEPGATEDPAVPQEPTVSTYHSYANSLVRSYGLRLGVEADTVLLGQAQAWQLAHRLVESWDGPLPESMAAVSTLTAGLMSLASESSEHLVAPARVGQWAHQFRMSCADVPPVGRKKSIGKPAQDALNRLETTELLAQLVERFQRAKAYESALDYGDLLALAAEIVNVDPRACATERDRFKVVLLDEFQDTSHAQLKLFSGLFGEGHCVMAVGDPQQSIYGFRGASAGQLFSFVENFPRSNGQSAEPAAFADSSFLTVAWRNCQSVLEAANRIAAPLRTPPEWNRSASTVQVPPLDASPHASVGSVRVSRYVTDSHEAQATARAIAQQRGAHEGQPLEEMPTMAVLCRKRAQFEPIRLELEALDVPYEVVGLGGLLSTPEVADIVATLYVLTDPGRSDALARLLAGARWRIGPKDLAALGDWAGHLETSRSRAAAARGTELSAEELAQLPAQDPTETVAEGDIVDRASLIEAIETLPSDTWVSHRGRSISAPALGRMRRLGSELSHLRSALGDELTSVIHEVETTLGLDVELAANPGMTPAQARKNIDSFYDQAVQFSATTRTHDVATFLSWLEAAAHEENGLELPPEDTRHDAVQLLTVHAAKGLEWDHVYVPGMNQGDFPSKRKSAWTGDAAKLPWPLRGDAQQLPQWNADPTDVETFKESFELFLEDAGAHDEAEERRLAYVACTRAKTLLELSCSVFRGTAKTAHEPSVFLDAVRAMTEESHPGVELGEWAEVEPGTENPQADTVVSALWPYDPLEGPEIVRKERSVDGREKVTVSTPVHSGRRARMDRAAHAVQTGGFDTTRELTAQHLEEGEHGAMVTRWRREAELLLAKRDAVEQRNTVHMPSHVSASALVAMDTNPEAFIMGLRRPMPARPGSAARAGTTFHTWVENFFGDSAIFDMDELPGADDYVDEELDLPGLAETFKNSQWASRQPYAIELPVETPVGSVTVRGRIDAVFRTDSGGWELIDWKTGRVPRGKDLRRKSGQLALYRLAFARLHGLDLADVSAAFYYVSEDKEVRPHDLATDKELEAIVESMYSMHG
ncbi:ATP-dependent DNA helicase [Kocuria sp.]|uniref:ATP-dependent helicase n=1 Tax=Kocuria sp. TaxID=1871328 RepID=UPI0026DFAEF6|nr:ATP-dependent DNA helicase [Kocuria sp.]MDO5366926.1 ATP-dependent DNA helicase [Kocuria sp.]